jgi:hypothetical protein
MNLRYLGLGGMDWINPTPTGGLLCARQRIVGFHTNGNNFSVDWQPFASQGHSLVHFLSHPSVSKKEKT